MGEILAHAVSPDGRLLAVGTDPGDDYYTGGELRLWDTATGTLVNTLSGIPGGISFISDRELPGRLRWHPGGRLVGAVFDTNRVGLFDPFGSSSEPLDALDLTDGWGRGPAWCFSPDGARIAVSCYTGTAVPLFLAEVRADGFGPAAGVGPATEDQGVVPLEELDWSADGARIAGFGHAVHVLDVVSGELSTAPWAAPAAFAPDGRTLAKVDGLRLSIGTSLYDLPGTAAMSVHWSPDGRRLVALTDAGATLVTAGAELLRAIPGVPVVAGADLDGERLALLIDGRLQVWGAAGLEYDAEAADGGTAVALAGPSVIEVGPDYLRFSITDS
ncbi:WD40 repeat domain-containing protein [Dactylosporangium sp. NPDC051541]|uniref:WD40 repeat domain-containing protein n=1 Tax=Dactylosporangium sp. NPDC051541 TaxID=3363977 RepID=UPI0037B6702E